MLTRCYTDITVSYKPKTATEALRP